MEGMEVHDIVRIETLSMVGSATSDFFQFQANTSNIAQEGTISIENPIQGVQRNVVGLGVDTESNKVGDNMMVGSKGKWKRLSPSRSMQDKMDEKGESPKQKRKMSTNTIDEEEVGKMQKLEKETKALSKLMAQHLGSVMATIYAAPLGSMGILIWNCQGLGNHQTIQALKRALHDEAPKVLFLIEKKLP